jgi:hypothetical protein
MLSTATGGSSSQKSENFSASWLKFINCFASSYSGDYSIFRLSEPPRQKNR